MNVKFSFSITHFQPIYTYDKEDLVQMEF